MGIFNESITNEAGKGVGGRFAEYIVMITPGLL
jgi:hypothetical protein